MLNQCLQGKERHEDKEEEEEIEMLSQCLQDKEEEEIEMLSHCLQDKEGHEDKEEEEEIEMLSQCPQDEEVVPLSLQFTPEKTSLKELQQQFERQPSLTKAQSVGIKRDSKYDDIEGGTGDSYAPHKYMPIVIDPRW